MCNFEVQPFSNLENRELEKAGLEVRASLQIARLLLLSGLDLFYNRLVAVAFSCRSSVTI